MATFLDFSAGIGAWNPTLALVMGGALVLTLPVFHLWAKAQTPRVRT